MKLKTVQTIIISMLVILSLLVTYNFVIVPYLDNDSIISGDNHYAPKENYNYALVSINSLEPFKIKTQQNNSLNDTIQEYFTNYEINLTQSGNILIECTSPISIVVTTNDNQYFFYYCETNIEFTWLI